jgi:hypothetical protein
MQQISSWYMKIFFPIAFVVGTVIGLNDFFKWIQGIEPARNAMLIVLFIGIVVGIVLKIIATFQKAKS